MAELHLTRRQREDPLVIAWVRIQDWFLANTRVIGIVMLTALVIAAIGTLWLRGRARAESNASAKLAEASALYWQGKYDQLLQRSDEIRRDYQGTPSATEAMRLRGDALFWQGDFKKAAEAYETYLKENRTSSAIRAGVKRNLAQAYEGDNQFQKAATIYEELANEPGPRLIVGELVLAAARSWEHAGNTAHASTLYQRVATEFSDTPYAATAEVALGEIEARGSSPPAP